MTGGIVGVGTINAPETGGASFAAAVGGGAAFVGNAAKQAVAIHDGDQKGVNVASAVVDTAVGAATGGLAPKAIGDTAVPVLSAGRNSFNAIGKAVRTKIEEGIAKTMSPKTAVKAAVGSQAAETGRTAAGAGVDAIKSMACQKTVGC